MRVSKKICSEEHDYFAYFMNSWSSDECVIEYSNKKWWCTFANKWKNRK